ncbi:MAG TPA: patatin-like phospholipase family protein [Acetobacteraceae bacterium]|jgi:patatin-like phospholipase/acyl hydrolase|nr:patatin-like phospholipase family protein [Acetobacteraceae bacterium]
MSTFRILAIDGGGIRGVIPAIFLAKIAAHLGGGPLSSHFDLIAGTSTGSLIAAAAACDENIQECVDLYRLLGPEIFPPMTVGHRERKWTDIFKLGPSYSDKPLANALQKMFGLTRKLSDANTRLMITSYDVLNRQIYLMRSHEQATSVIPMWEACKASCSAPTYFPAHILTADGVERPLIDGGVFSNNPSTLAVSEAIRIARKDGIRDFQKENRIVLVSLGSGNLLRKISVDQARDWGPLRWIKPLIDVLLDGTAEAAHISARHIVTSANYVRWQVDLSDVNDDLDDASSENIDALQGLANAYLDCDDGAQREAYPADSGKHNI